MTLRQIPANATPDSVVITFIYKKNGADIEFDSDHFPKDFNDSAYQFVSRYDKVVRKGNAEPPIKDFILINDQEQDITDSVLSINGRILIIFSKTWDDEWTVPYQQLNDVASAQHIPIFISTSAPDKVRQHIQGNVLKSDFVAIKTAARVDPTIYLLEDGVIREKWALADKPKLVTYLNK